MALKYSPITTIAAPCLIFIMILSGCAQQVNVAERWAKDGHVFVPADPIPAKSPQIPSIPKEKPIVKVISGTEFSSLDEAKQRISEHDKKRDLGLKTNVSQLVVEDVPLRQVAGTLSELTDYNIAVTQNASQIPISIYLRNLPLRQALETICRLYGLWYREDERIVTLMTTEEYSEEMVIRRNEKSRAYWLRYTNANDMAKILQAVMSSKVVFNDIGEEEVYGHVEEDKDAGESVDIATSDETATASGKNMNIQGFSAEEIRQLLNLGAVDRQQRGDALAMNKTLNKEVPAMITVFKRNNAILARSLDETVLQDIGRIIELMDTPTSEVLLEISILQLTLGDGFESFFDIDMSEINVGLSDIDLGTGLSDIKLGAETLAGVAGPATETLSLVAGNSSISARLELFAKEDRVEVLATPYLMSANNSKVEFFVGQEVPLRDDVESETLYDSDGNVTGTSFEVTINREELGTDIEISSFINEDGTITMDLETEISSAQYNMTSIGVINDVTGETVQFPLDGKETQEMTSIVTAASGQTIALGGIIREHLQEYENKVPVLGDIPMVGFFFKDIEDVKEKTETILLLTPHIIRHPAQAEAVGNYFLNRRSSHPRYSNEQQNLLDYKTGEMHKFEKESTYEPGDAQTVE